MNHFEIRIPVTDEELRSILIAQLAETGYTGFEESDDSLKAYINESDFDENDINNLLNQYNLSYSKSIINKQNWNQLWESNFEPVQVNDFVGIRASFHPEMTGVEHEIVITPKMSFGTGHHATTWLVMQMMQGIDFQGKSVFDFGTGTGILAILAEKLGAGWIRAVDNDDWCIENASENISINNCQQIEIQKNDTVKNENVYDIFIANINRNIILDNRLFISDSVAGGGQLIVSGLLTDDEKDISDAFAGSGMIHVQTTLKNGWIAIHFRKL
jgi:ribosomal protein L11 methyltransferase